MRVVASAENALMKNVSSLAALVVLILFGTVGLPAAPSIGAVGVTPQAIEVGTAISVVVTAQIADPSLISTSVNLLRVDGSGRTLANLGLMNDTGIDGDAVAGDRVFSKTAPLREESIGMVRFRVSAAFRGVLQRALSPIVAVHVWQRSTDTQQSISALTPPNWEFTSLDEQIEMSSPVAQEAAQAGATMAAPEVVLKNAQTTLNLTDFIAAYRDGWYSEYACAPIVATLETVRCTSEFMTIERQPTLAGFVRASDTRLILAFGTDVSTQDFDNILRSIRPF